MGMYSKYAKEMGAKGAIAPKIFTGADNYFDILFSPGGQVLDYSGGLIILWVWLEAPNSDEYDHNPTLLVIYINSGSVAAYDPVESNPPAPFVKVKS
jgi:hypothetical protein